MDNRWERLSEKERNKMHAIGKVAARLFDKKGYLETSLKDISIEAGLSKGCIYYYFSSKHEILYFILDVYMDHLLNGLEDGLANIDDYPKKIQFIMSRHLMLYNNRIPEAKAILLDAHNLPSEYYKNIATKQKTYARILADTLSEYFNGKMEIDKSKAISYIFFGMCNSIMHWHNPEGPVTLEELSNICYDIFLNGISCYNNVSVNSIAEKV